MKTKCKDCGVEISEHAMHTGREQWCEDCFDKGLHKDMNDHFKNFVEEEMNFKDREHVLSKDCWCVPTLVQAIDDEHDAEVWVHKGHEELNQ